MSTTTNIICLTAAAAAVFALSPMPEPEPVPVQAIPKLVTPTVVYDVESQRLYITNCAALTPEQITSAYRSNTLTCRKGKEQ